MAKLIAPVSNSVTSVTFTTSQTWTSPVGVTNLITVVGKGADGTAAVPPTYDGDVPRIGTVTVILGFNSTPSSPYGSGNTPGSWSWAASQNDAPTCASTINLGGSGSVNGYIITQYGTEYHYDFTTITYTNAITGSATVSTDAGWKTSGLVVDGDNGTSYVHWAELGSYSGGSSATTGANTTGFSKTFSGGVGVTATTTTYNNVTITASTGYPLVVPSGGYITITY
jgi:hypothetical protein